MLKMKNDETQEVSFSASVHSQTANAHVGALSHVAASSAAPPDH